MISSFKVYTKLQKIKKGTLNHILYNAKLYCLQWSILGGEEGSSFLISDGLPGIWFG
jgi:hypothetical protein